MLRSFSLAMAARPFAGATGFRKRSETRHLGQPLDRRSMPEPYKTYFWILVETGVRAGEIGALTVRNVLQNSNREKFERQPPV